MSRHDEDVDELIAAARVGATIRPKVVSRLLGLSFEQLLLLAERGHIPGAAVLTSRRITFDAQTIARAMGLSWEGR